MNTDGLGEYEYVVFILLYWKAIHTKDRGLIAYVAIWIMVKR
jgi:hypothetical protein